MILCGDIGATKSLLSLAECEGGKLTLVFEQRYANVQWPDFSDLVVHFLSEAAATRGEAACLSAAGFGVAGPVEHGYVRMTNRGWALESAALTTLLGGCPVSLVNDFEAAAHGLADLGKRGCVTLQAGEPRTDSPQLLIGAGSGLGVALRVPARGGPVVIGSEGGHVGFAPLDEEQVALWRHLQPRLGRVTAEHVVSGPGLARIHHWLAQESGASEAAAGLTGEAVWRRACEDGDPLALRALELFIECYGAVAGDHALATLARGGVYVFGGVAPRILPQLTAGGFLTAFRNKGAQSALAAAMPVHVVVDANLPLYGAARAALRLVEET